MYFYPMLPSVRQKLYIHLFIKTDNENDGLKISINFHITLTKIKGLFGLQTLKHFLRIKACKNLTASVNDDHSLYLKIYCICLLL